MPGSGKSTIGKKISELLSRPFYDTDEEAEKEIGNIAEYIKNNGEAAFRAVEKRVIKELCEKVTGAVISTGGGAVLDTDNILRLRRNGRIYFIDRNIDLITPTSSRPLSRDRAALKKRFEERYDIYKSTSDVIIENNASFTDAAKKIAEDFPG
ncbi:MAG: shikimate kinase, partial [Eubacteriales bacterium]